jgi:hypothetical protein
MEIWWDWIEKYSMEVRKTEQIFNVSSKNWADFQCKFEKLSRFSIEVRKTEQIFNGSSKNWADFNGSSKNWADFNGSSKNWLDIRWKSEKLSKFSMKVRITEQTSNERQATKSIFLMNRPFKSEQLASIIHSKAPNCLAETSSNRQNLIKTHATSTQSPH